MSRLLVLVLALLCGSGDAGHAQAAKESWYLLRGRANMEIGNYRAAIEAFAEALKVNPDNREALRSLGMAYEAQGLTDQAIEQFDRYLEQYPDDAEIAFKQARYLEGSRYGYRKKDAARYYEMGLKARFEEDLQRDPENPREALRSLGVAYEKQGLIDQAVEQFDRYLERYPDDAEIAFKQARYLEGSRYARRKKDVLKYYKMGLKARDDRPMRLRLARLLAADKATLDEALAEYRTLVQDDPQDQQIREEYRKLLLWDKRHLDEAIREHERLAAQHPRDFGVQRQLAGLLARAPRRRAEALRLYERLVDQRPGDASLREEYARMLSQDQERFAAARGEFEAVLRQKNSFSTRLAYADLLASREATRAEALEQYKRLVKQAPDDNRVRLKYARLLSAQRGTLPQAIDQYRQVLRREPEHGEAHQGLAHAYAWLGNGDQALYHARRARRDGAGNAPLVSLEQNFEKGRETTVKPNLSFVSQPQGRFELSGFTATLQARGELTPFMTNELEIGREYYWNADEQVRGNLFHLGTQYRFSPARRLEGSFSRHTLRRAGPETEFYVQYGVERGDRAFRAGFRRALRYDSMLALAGHQIRGRPLGGASANLFYAAFQYRLGRLAADASPYVGWISAASATPNFLTGAEASARLSLKRSAPLRIFLAYQAQVAHYGRDRSGLSPSRDQPLPGGYFSPQLFLNHSPRFEIDYTSPDAQTEMEVRAGPAYQFVENSATRKTYRGVDLSASWSRAVRRSLYWNLSAAFTQVGEVYNRYSIRYGFRLVF